MFKVVQRMRVFSFLKFSLFFYVEIRPETNIVAMINSLISMILIGKGRKGAVFTVTITPEMNVSSAVLVSRLL